MILKLPLAKMMRLELKHRSTGGFTKSPVGFTSRWAVYTSSSCLFFFNLPLVFLSLSPPFSFFLVLFFWSLHGAGVELGPFDFGKHEPVPCRPVGHGGRWARRRKNGQVTAGSTDHANCRSINIGPTFAILFPVTGAQVRPFCTQSQCC
jgi:hypothetical protein